MDIRQLLFATLLLGFSYIFCKNDEVITDTDKIEYCQKTPQYSKLTQSECKSRIKSTSKETDKYLSMLKANKHYSRGRLTQINGVYMNRKRHYKKNRKNNKQVVQLKRQASKALLNYMLVAEIYNFIGSTPGSFERSFFESALKDCHKEYMAKSSNAPEDMINASGVAADILSLNKSKLGATIFAEMHDRLKKNN